MNIPPLAPLYCAMVLPQMEPLREDPQYQTFDYLMKEFHLQQEIESATRVSEPSGAVLFSKSKCFFFVDVGLFGSVFSTGHGTL